MNSERGVRGPLWSRDCTQPLLEGTAPSLVTPLSPLPVETHVCGLGAHGVGGPVIAKIGNNPYVLSVEK